MVTDIEGTAAKERSAAQVQDMQELVEYYREMFGILSQYALSQTSGQMIHRDLFKVQEIADYAESFVRKTGGKNGYGGKLSVEAGQLSVTADRVMVEYLIENLLECGMREGGDMKLEIVPDGSFVRFILHRECSTPGSDVLDGLFTPLMNKDNMAYVICRQIIREHDEAFGHPGCRINADAESGGMAVWFTVPAAKQK